MNTRLTMRSRLAATATVLACLAFPADSTQADEVLWGVTDNNFLISWNSSEPNALLSGSAIKGLQPGEQILGIDIRPEDNRLYAVGSSNRLYRLGAQNGSAVHVGLLGVALDGSAFGYDFNPTIDLSRIDTNTNANYVINPNDAQTVQVNDVFYAAGDTNFGADPNIAHIAYTNSFSGATTSQLYGIDTGLDVLVTQANSDGTLQTVGSLGIDISELGGFDISGNTGIAYAALQSTSSSISGFYAIDLATGATKFLGEIGGGTRITALTVQSVVPEPAATLLIGVLGLVTLRRRRRS